MGAIPETTVGEAGEEALLLLIEPYLASADDVLLVPPPGDDTAVVRLPEAKLQVLTTDLLAEGTHFLRNEQTCWKSLGRRSLVASLSDLAAMGAYPANCLVSIGLPHDFCLTAFEQLFLGMAEEAGRCGLRLVGGDTVRSEIVVLNVAVTGYKDPADARCARSDCRVGDYLYVSGEGLGGCRAGLELLLQGEAALEVHPLIARQQIPVPRLALGRQIAQSLERAGMMDVSDGLVTDLTRMARASNLAFVIELPKVPLFNGVEQYCASSGRDPSCFALFSGEEFELLFSCPFAPEELARIVRLNEHDTTAHFIGRAVPGEGVVVVDGSGQRIELQETGFHHFDTA